MISKSDLREELIAGGFVHPDKEDIVLDEFHQTKLAFFIHLLLNEAHDEGYDIGCEEVVPESYKKFADNVGELLTQYSSNFNEFQSKVNKLYEDF